MDFQTEAKLKEAISLMQQGQPLEARDIINFLFEKGNLDCSELVFTNKYCQFWIDSIARLKKIEDTVERSENILSEWKNFQAYIERTGEMYEPAFFAFQQGYFSAALKFYTKLLDEKDSFQKAEIYKKAGICYKKLGDFENARAFLTEANDIYPNLSPVIAELADCYSLCGNDKISKVLFREAFFKNPEAIDLDFLDSELIKCLIKSTKEKGYSGKTLKYWIPVYGVLNGVFIIKRELSSQEVARLKKDIYAMENEFKDPSCNSELLIPHLLNCYFWLMDHYFLTRESPSKTNEILLKIKILDSNVYDLYTK